MNGAKIRQLARQIEAADAILIGAGAGLSTSAGLTYSGARFQRYFADFIDQYAIGDMYSGGFYPFETPEETWAWWSRQIYYNRYVEAPKPVYRALLRLVREKDFFVLTTNVDHQFQMAGFERQRLFYTQGDYGLWQCSQPCHLRTYDNEKTVRRMVAEQEDMRVPSALIPHCPVCGKPMTMNLRSDDRFVEDEGWHEAAKRYERFLYRHRNGRVLFLELGVGYNTPGIIKYPFWRMVDQNPRAIYVCVNIGDSFAPAEIRNRSICVDGDIGEVLTQVMGEGKAHESAGKTTFIDPCTDR